MNDPKYVYIPSHGLWEIWGVVSNEGETIISASEKLEWVHFLLHAVLYQYTWRISKEGVAANWHQIIWIKIRKPTLNEPFQHIVQFNQPQSYSAQTENWSMLWELLGWPETRQQVVGIELSLLKGPCRSLCFLGSMRCSGSWDQSCRLQLINDLSLNYLKGWQAPGNANVDDLKTSAWTLHNFQCWNPTIYKCNTC